MSYIKPKQYYQIAEQMAEAYSRIRDVLNDASALEEIDHSTWTDDTFANDLADYSAGANANDFAVNIVQQLVEEPDDNSDVDTSVIHDVTRDPVGSIASDLGRTFATFGQTFTEAEAKSLAGAFFTSALRALNSHVVSRTPLPPTVSQPPQGGGTTMRNINEYYGAYDDDPRSYPDADDEPMSLFTWAGGGDYFGSATYFSDNFVELSAQAGVTINDEFQTSYWS